MYIHRYICTYIKELCEYSIVIVIVIIFIIDAFLIRIIFITKVTDCLKKIFLKNKA